MYDQYKLRSAYDDVSKTFGQGGFESIQNNPDIKHMAATQNEVLAKLGSSLRISDDATYDDVRSAADGVDKWRLYFSSYNMENPLLDGVEFDAEHPYDKLYTERFSHYGGRHPDLYAARNGQPGSLRPCNDLLCGR